MFVIKNTEMNVSEAENVPQVKLHNLLQKKFSKQSEKAVGFGITCPMWVEYLANRDANRVKRKLQKEASESALNIRHLTEAYKNGKSVTEKSMYNFIKMGLPDSEQERYARTGVYGLSQESKNFLDNAGACIKKMSQDLDPEPLKKLFEKTIKKERAYAAVAALFVRVLSGAEAPKVKFLHSPENLKTHGQLLSSFIDGCDLIGLTEKSISLDDYAPKLAAAALMRYMLGGDPKEVKLDNFLCSDGKILNIDMDYSFNARHCLSAQNSGSSGAKQLFACDLDDSDRMIHKKFWDSLFGSKNDAEVTNAMNEMFERAALVLTDELIEYVVGSVQNQDQSNDIFALSKEDSEHLIKFMRTTREICKQKLIDANVPAKYKDAAEAAPWLKAMMAEAAKYQETKNKRATATSTI